MIIFDHELIYRSKMILLILMIFILLSSIHWSATAGFIQSFSSCQAPDISEEPMDMVTDGKKHVAPLELSGVNLPHW